MRLLALLPLLFLLFAASAHAQSSQITTDLGSLSADGERITYHTTAQPERTISRDLLALGRFDTPDTHDAENVRMLLTSAEMQGQTLEAPPLAADTLLETVAELQAEALAVADTLAALRARLADNEGLPEQLATCQASVDDLTAQNITANDNANAALQTLRNAMRGAGQ